MENQGGGFYSEDGSPILRDCVFIGNSAAAGAGFFCLGGEPLIEGCGFIENSARGFGGGIGTESGAFPEIRGCRFIQNEASDGAGVCISASNATISACDFLGNSSDFGGGISLVSAESVVLDRLVIAGNHAVLSGGGIHALYAGADLLRSTVAFNVCSGEGGGIYGFQSEIMINTVTITHNDGPGLTMDGSTVSMGYSDVFGNQGEALEGEFPAGTGTLTGVNTNGDSIDVYANIFQNPEYLAEDMFNLPPRQSSPLIDAGDPGLPEDVDGTTTDMGAFPYTNPLDLDVSVPGGTLHLQWSAHDQASAYCVYGMNCCFYFNPNEGLLLEECPEGVTNWSTDWGFGDPENQWTFKVVAIDRYEREITRSNVGGEFDRSWDVP